MPTHASLRKDDVHNLLKQMEVDFHLDLPLGLQDQEEEVVVVGEEEEVEEGHSMETPAQVNSVTQMTLAIMTSLNFA